MDWSAAQYSKFEAERTRPARDLLARVLTTNVAAAVDLGCGPANSTELLQALFPSASVKAIDSSAGMIEAAQKRLPNIQFEVADITTWSDPGPFDLILANASLQWVPDHERLLPALMAKLTVGGTLAVQIPDNLDEPAHRLMRQIAADGPWRAKLADASSANANRHSADWYYHALLPLASVVDVWRTTYYHPLAGGAEAVTEWFKGTGLRPFLDPLNPSERDNFLESYQAGIAKAYPAMPDGTVLLPFPRLFVVAAR